MKCDSCNVEIAEGAKFCPLCGKGKGSFFIDCPYCEHRMERGLAQIHSTFFKVLMTGLGQQNLYFQKTGQPEKMVMNSKSKQEAFFCENCESIFIRA